MWFFPGFWVTSFAGFFQVSSCGVVDLILMAAMAKSKVDLGKKLKAFWRKRSVGPKKTIRNCPVVEKTAKKWVGKTTGLQLARLKTMLFF